MDEYGFGLNWECDIFRKPLTAIFPHPLHGRLVEKVVLMVSRLITFDEVPYVISWRHDNVIYYRPLARE